MNGTMDVLSVITQQTENISQLPELVFLLSLEAPAPSPFSLGRLA